MVSSGCGQAGLVGARSRGGRTFPWWDGSAVARGRALARQTWDAATLQLPLGTRSWQPVC